MKNLNEKLLTRQDRIGKRQLASYIDDDTFLSFKILSAELSVNTNDLVNKAVALLLDHYKKPVPATLRRRVASAGLSCAAYLIASASI